MLQSILQYPNSFGYVILPTLESFSRTVYNTTFSQFSLCTVINQSNGSCLNSIELDYELQTNSLADFSIQSNGAALPPSYDWSCTNCWFFSGFTYWYTEEVYSFPSGCGDFISNLNDVLNWIYTDPTALAQSRDAHYYLPQGSTNSILQSNLERITCMDSPSSIIGVAVIYSWIVTVSIILIFSLFICCRLTYGVRKKYKRIKENPITFSLQAEGPLEITPLLMTAQIDRKDIELTTQIGTGSFGEVRKLLPLSISSFVFY